MAHMKMGISVPCLKDGDDSVCTEHQQLLLNFCGRSRWITKGNKSWKWRFLLESWGVFTRTGHGEQLNPSSAVPLSDVDHGPVHAGG